MFQKHGVTGQKRRSSKAKNLPKRIIPGHNGQYGSQRLKTHIRLAVFCGDLHRPQKGRAILSIIATDPGTLFQLGTGLLQRLTHLQRHRKSQTLLLLFQLLRQSLQQIHPFFNTAAPPLVPEGLCIVERLIHSSPLPFFITAHHLTRSRINRLQHHWEPPFNIFARPPYARSGWPSWYKSATILRHCPTNPWPAWWSIQYPHEPPPHRSYKIAKPWQSPPEYRYGKSWATPSADSSG